MDQQTSRFRRDYDGALADLRERFERVAVHDWIGPPLALPARMQLLADVLWDHFGGEGDGRCVSWVGFYMPHFDDHGEAVEMVLCPCRDKPACSPIGLHGACGRAYLAQAALVITDVANLGDNYVACDPCDRAELVIPCFDKVGGCWAVLDFDSQEPHAFSQEDIAPIVELLSAVDLTRGAPTSATVV